MGRSAFVSTLPCIRLTSERQCSASPPRCMFPNGCCSSG